MTTRSHCLLFHKRSTDWDSPLGYKQVISQYTRRISLLLTLVLGFASDSCNNNDILLVVGYNYNVTLPSGELKAAQARISELKTPLYIGKLTRIDCGL